MRSICTLRKCCIVCIRRYYGERRLIHTVFPSEKVFGCSTLAHLRRAGTDIRAASKSAALACPHRGRKSIDRVDTICEPWPRPFRCAEKSYRKCRYNCWLEPSGQTQPPTRAGRPTVRNGRNMFARCL